MIKKLYLKNFRGIRDSEIELSPITLLTGANNSGKSSIMYGLLTLKNVATTPNQPLDSFFNFQFLSLGNFKESVFLKDEDRDMIIEIESLENGRQSRYGVQLGKKKSSFNLSVFKPYQVSLTHSVTFPYPGNTTTGADMKGDFGSAKISWNGLTSTISITDLQGSKEEESLLNLLGLSLNFAYEEIKMVDFVPLKRGFIQPNFSAVPLTEPLIKEEQIATLVANDRDLEGKINYYLEKVVDKNFGVRAILGSASFHLQTNDRATGFVCDLASEGFGTNQLVYILAKALRKEHQTICIEEPEIHLHPDAISKLVEVLVQISKDEKKNFIISTHSQHLVFSFLNKVVQKKASPEDIGLYFLSKKRQETIVEKQEVNEKGQVSDGLKSFYEAEMREFREFLNIPKGE